MPNATAQMTINQLIRERAMLMGQLGDTASALMYAYSEIDKLQARVADNEAQISRMADWGH